MNDTTLDPAAHIAELGKRARGAARQLIGATTEAKNLALTEAAKALRGATARLIAANEKDVAGVRGKKPDSFIDRLMLDEARIAAMADALDEIARLPDPVGRRLATFDRPNGLKIERVAVPIGVIGMIYESRPNVGADASALCLKSGNAIILRGGSESRHSTREIVACMQAGLSAAGLPENAVQTVGTTSREAVAELDAQGLEHGGELEIGIMVETPAAVMAADLLATECDFFSIGSNDLIQYTLAMDRGNERVSYLYQPLHPAILQSLARVVEAGHAHGIWVGICGEMGSETRLAEVLLGLGLDEISTHGVALPKIKQVIRWTGLAEARSLVGDLMKLSTAEEANAFLALYIAERKRLRAEKESNS